MKDMQKTVKVKKRQVSIDGEVMFLRLLAINSYKKVPLQRLMAFENAPAPLSIFQEDGTMRSCTKSDFMHMLEDLVSIDSSVTLQD